MLMSGLKTTIAFQVNLAINMEQIEICKMQSLDVSAVCEIERACFSMPFKENDFYEYLKNPLWHLLVAKIDGKVVGYISYMIIGYDADLVNIAVLPEFRGKKVGQALLHELVMDADSRDLEYIHLEVRKSNASAINLYTKYGFVIVGQSKNHYSNPTEDALRMNLAL